MRWFKKMCNGTILSQLQNTVFHVKAVFQLTVESNFAITFVLHCSVCDWLLKNTSRHFLNQSEVKRKRIVTCSQAFSRALRRLHVFASRFNWFLGRTASVAICQRNYFGFGFATLN